MAKIILVRKNHPNEASATISSKGIVAGLEKRGHEVELKTFPYRHSVLKRLLSATPRRPYVKYISQRERNWFEKIKKDNPDAIVIGIHNFVYVPEPSEKLGGKIKLQKGDTIAAIAGKNPAWLLGVPEIRGEVHANIEIPAVYRIPTRLEEKRRTLFEALKSRFRSFERIETEALLDEYLKTVDIKASREAGLMGEKMEEAIVEGIHEDILPKFLKGRRK